MAKRLSWAVRLERAEKRGRFTGQEHEWADTWNTCAVGEFNGWPSSRRLPKDTSPELEQLGFLFMYAVNADDVEKAASIYQQIQELPA